MSPRLLRNMTRRPSRLQRGLSLVELMVGITVGMFVVAAAAALVANQLADNRNLLLETQVQQDLRASMDIIVRQLRRTGYSKNGGLEVLMLPAAASMPAPNPHTTITQASSDNLSAFYYYYSSGAQGPYGFKLDSGVIRTRLPLAGGWQDLTDKNTLRVTDFSITPTTEEIRLPCPKECPGGGQACWPQVVVRTFKVVIEGQAVSDAASANKRRIESDVRLRNDWLKFNSVSVCPA